MHRQNIHTHAGPLADILTLLHLWTPISAWCTHISRCAHIGCILSIPLMHKLCSQMNFCPRVPWCISNVFIFVFAVIFSFVELLTLHVPAFPSHGLLYTFLVLAKDWGGGGGVHSCVISKARCWFLLFMNFMQCITQEVFFCNSKVKTKCRTWQDASMKGDKPNGLSSCTHVLVEWHGCTALVIMN